METLLKRKTLWQFTKTIVIGTKYEHEKLMAKGKKDEAIGVMTTYISRQNFFHTSGINFSNEFQKRLKNLFDMVIESLCNLRKSLSLCNLSLSRGLRII